MLLQGKNAVITGCLKGIGREAMELFSRQAENIWACSRFEDAAFEASIKQAAAMQHAARLTGRAVRLLASFEPRHSVKIA